MGRPFHMDSEKTGSGDASEDHRAMPSVSPFQVKLICLEQPHSTNLAISSVRPNAGGTISASDLVS